MSRQSLADRIADGLLILDGAMGTQLMTNGIQPGQCNDYLNIDNPEVIARIHSAYFEAGSDAVLTNTFGANKFTLSRHGYTEIAEKINFAGAQNGRKAAGDDKYVIGDIGPTGDFLKPLGTLDANGLRAAFAQQAKGLADGGVDGFVVETLTALDEAVIAVEAVKSVSDLPIFVSFAYGPGGESYKTMMGVDVDSVVSQIVPLGVSAVGFNCGTIPMAGYVKLTENYARLLADSDTVIIAEPNAGLPELVDGETVYRLEPGVYAEFADKIVDAGATIIGGCCGTTPEHIKALAKKLRG
jgi:5-methyltetrahydrofolate--homocysteine methyltransferase